MCNANRQRGVCYRRLQEPARERGGIVGVSREAMGDRGHRGHRGPGGDGRVFRDRDRDMTIRTSVWFVEREGLFYGILGG